MERFATFSHYVFLVSVAFGSIKNNSVTLYTYEVHRHSGKGMYGDKRQQHFVASRPTGLHNMDMLARSSMTQSTRERLLLTMEHCLTTTGFHNSGLSSILEAANVPKGVLYHHFPGGKNELARLAIERSAERILKSLDATLLKFEDSAVDALEAWMTHATKRLKDANFGQGCPLATVTLETANELPELRETLARAFQLFRSKIAEALGRSNPRYSAQDSEERAAFIVSAYEGALMQARASGNALVLEQTTRALVRSLRSELP
jgi:TetR/AcrR family transcriptional regulator, lmrAB and yxaGH operons repressor